MYVMLAAPRCNLRMSTIRRHMMGDANDVKDWITTLTPTFTSAVQAFRGNNSGGNVRVAVPPAAAPPSGSVVSGISNATLAVGGIAGVALLAAAMR